MGFNTTVVVHNDSLDVIERDPEFGKKLAAAIRRLSVVQHQDKDEIVDVPALNHVNAAEVIEQHHADFIQLVAVGGNMAWVLPGSVICQRNIVDHFGSVENMKLDLLKDFANQMGYSLRKKNKGP